MNQVVDKVVNRKKNAITLDFRKEERELDVAEFCLS